MIVDLCYVVVGLFKGLQHHNWRKILVNGLSCLVCRTWDIFIFTDRDLSDVCSLRLDCHGKFDFDFPFKLNPFEIILLNGSLSEALAESVHSMESR